MDRIMTLLNWFTGGENQYMRLAGCMKHDYFWISVTIALCTLIAVGYGLITLHWWRNQKTLPKGSPARVALGDMRNIFLFCCICGYVFIPVKMFWPAWRLYDFFLATLAIYTWKYALSARSLKVIYTELGRTKQLVEDLAKSREETRQKAFFLNALSHDLRTPLNALSLQASVLEFGSEDHDAATVQEAARHIRANASAAAELLDRLLDYARLNQGSGERNQISQIHTKALFLNVMNACAPAAGVKNLTLVDESLTHVDIFTDPIKVERVLMNFVSNALKFTQQGGVFLSVAPAGSDVEIRVRDTGPGVPLQHQERLFDEFYQIENPERDRIKGFGLGLAIARHLARQLGGDVGVESAPGHGSTFFLKLPGCRRQTINESTPSHHAPAHVTVPVSTRANLAAGAS